VSLYGVYRHFQVLRLLSTAWTLPAIWLPLRPTHQVYQSPFGLWEKVRSETR
jgi:hypothetical protein